MGESAFRRFLAARRRFRWEHAAVDGVRMSVRRSLQTPADPDTTVVLLPGLGLTGRYILPLGAALASRHPVVVPDLPGYAGRRAPGRALDMPGLADAVVGWLDRAQLDRAVLVGNSMGCQVAVEAAVRHPERIVSVVLEGPTIDASARTWWQQTGRIFLAGRREPPSLGPLQFSDWVTFGPRNLLATIRYAFAHRVEDLLPRVACPTLVVRGSEDPLVPHGWAARVAAGLQHGSLVEVPGAGHVLPYTTPETLAEIVVDFAAEHAR